WGEAAHTRATWYAPLEEQSDIDWAVHRVLQRPGIFLNTAGDIHLLPKVLDAAERFQPGQEVSPQPPSTLHLQPIFV
ncbi:MAG TPA: aldo/keto reductase, partial [Chloroflexota bacterium]